jgi:hypothetical protein
VPTTPDEALALQRTAGNAATVRALARKPRPGLMDTHLELDPEVQRIGLELSLERLLEHLGDAKLPEPWEPSLRERHEPSAKPPLNPAGYDDTPREAELGTFLGAVKRVPEVQRALDNLEWEVYGHLSDKDQNTLLVTGITFGAGALGGMLATKGGRDLLGQLSGLPLPVPKAPWLEFEFTTQQDRIGLGIHVDVGSLLGGRLGFGEARPQDPSINLYPNR